MKLEDLNVEELIKPGIYEIQLRLFALEMHIRHKLCDVKKKKVS